jgi:hypothetical protein
MTTVKLGKGSQHKLRTSSKASKPWSVLDGFLIVVGFALGLGVLNTGALYLHITSSCVNEPHGSKPKLTLPPKRRLEFVHIPKTGGGQIELAAAQRGIEWGMCHFDRTTPLYNRTYSKYLADYCPPESDLEEYPQVVSDNDTDVSALIHTGRYQIWHEIQERLQATPLWHLPPAIFEGGRPPHMPRDPYEGADLFAVVRDPYERIIAAYYSAQTFGKTKSDRYANDPVRLNRWLERWLIEYSENRVRKDLVHNVTGNLAYYLKGGDFIPQYDYIFEGRERIVKHVLRFDNLTAEFDELMKEYDLYPEVQLPEGDHPVQRFSFHARPDGLTVYNLTKVNLIRIERVYEDDFREWGFDVMTAKIPKEILDRNQDLMPTYH